MAFSQIHTTESIASSPALAACDDVLSAHSRIIIKSFALTIVYGHLNNLHAGDACDHLTT